MSHRTDSPLSDAERIANAVLYEGYILYPYRASSVKNQQRFTFGGVYPRAYSESQFGSDLWTQQTALLVRGSAVTTLDLCVRFLHLVHRQIFTIDHNGYVPVQSLRVNDRLLQTWQEGVEREHTVTGIVLANAGTQTFPFEFPATTETETLSYADTSTSDSTSDSTSQSTSQSATIAGKITRTAEAIQGVVELSCEKHNDIYKLTLRVKNLTILDTPTTPTREQALPYSFASCHTILTVHNGEFLSLIDPPAEHRDLAATCQNLGVFPVLVGEEGSHDTMLSSPIILYDYPQLAPESAGDLFDGTEIDEILSLRILTLTDDEKAQVRASDERAAAMLDRTENLPPEIWERLHGAVRGIRPVTDNQ